MNIDNLNWSLIRDNMDLRLSELQVCKETLKGFPIQISESNINYDKLGEFEVDDWDTTCTGQDAAGYIVSTFLQEYLVFDEIEDIERQCDNPIDYYFDTIVNPAGIWYVDMILDDGITAFLSDTEIKILIDNLTKTLKENLPDSINTRVDIE